jgi:hypothetical protein
MAGFLAKPQIFVVLPKFDQNNNFQKFKKDLVKKSSNHKKWSYTLFSKHPVAGNPCDFKCGWGLVKALKKKITD